MHVNEVCKRLQMTRRAVKYYEEQGLLHVTKDENGYRNYSEENIRTLMEISAYRKLGIGIHDIKLLLRGDRNVLDKIYQKKAADIRSSQKELDALAAYMKNQNVQLLNESLDYDTIQTSLQSLFPGFYGYYMTKHFSPFLQITITSEAQKKAYANILAFLDNAGIRLPLLIRLFGYLAYRFLPPDAKENFADEMNQRIQTILHPSEETFEALKERTVKAARRRQNPIHKYSPYMLSMKRLYKRLKDCGYNDIFIPNMMDLSPTYRQYHDALMQINDRVTKETGIHYDAAYNLVMH